MAIPRNLGNLASGADTNGVLGATKGGTGLASPGTSGNILTSNGTTWTSAAPAATGAPIGALQYFQGTTTAGYPGSDWLQCNAGVLLQSSYSTLYNRIGLIPNGGASYTFNVANAGIDVTNTSPNAVSGTGLAGIKYLAAGSMRVSPTGGAISTSTDAVTWNPVLLTSTATSMRVVKYLNGLYVVAGSNGLMFTSTNATAWAPRNPVVTNVITDVIYGTLYVACSQETGVGSPVISTSTDAITWTQRTAPTEAPLFSLSYNAALTNGKYVAVGGVGGTPRIYTSTDAISWTNRTAPGVQVYRCIAAAPALTNRYVAAGDAGSLASSTDGVTWTSRSAGSDNILSATFGASRYAILTGAQNVGRSTDGITWNFAALPSQGSTNYFSITFTDNRFVVLGQNGGVVTSTDAITWSPSGDVVASNYRAVDYNSSANLFVVGGNTPNGIVRTSTNGGTWTDRSLGASFNVEAIINTGSLYVVSGTSANIRTSTDTITWTARTSGAPGTVASLAYNPSSSLQFLATGASAYARTSTDAITWTAISNFPFTGGGDAVNCASANGLYFAYCDSPSLGPRVIVSRTGASNTWVFCTVRPQNNYNTSLTSNTIVIPTNIIYAGTQYFMCGQDMVGFSEDGINWIQYRVEFSFQSAVFVNGVYFATTDQGIVRSYDGLNWVLVYYGNSFTGAQGSRTIAASSDFVVAAGQGNVIATSNLFTYNKATEFALPQTTSLNLGTGTETLFIKAT